MKRPMMDSQNGVLDFIVRSLVGSDTGWIYRTDDLVVLADEAEESRFLQNVID